MSAPSASESPVDAALDSQPVRRPAGQRGDGPSDSLSGPEPPTAAARTAADDQIPSDAAITAPPSGAVILHRHALESVFAFLDLRELAAALRVARGWLASVQSMRRLELPIRRPKEPLVNLAQSTMSRHAAGLWSVRLDAAALSMLAARMGQLRALDCDLDVPTAAVPLVFPAQLRRLFVQLVDCADVADISVVITAIARLPQLEQLDITMPEIVPQISLAPLSALPRLRKLRVWWQWDECELSDAQVDQLRALPRLRKFDAPMSTSLLRRLLRQPHDLQWRQISLPWSLDDEDAALLPLLPLVSINVWTTCSRFDWLRGLPSLTDVSLTFNGSVDAAGRTASLVVALQCCTNIEILELNHCFELTAAQLAKLLPRLPRLRELRLMGLRIESLSFLSQPPMTNQLSRLRLLDCSRLPVAELRHVHSLRGLKQLELKNSFAAPLGDPERAQLTPPSPLLPLLEEFECGAP